MGRKKKEILQPSKEGMEYAIKTVREYSRMCYLCDEFEKAHPSLLKKGRVRIAAFEEMEFLSEDTFVIPDLGPCDAEKMDVYLSDKEKVYLLEYSLLQMDDTVRNVAKSLFIEKLSWEEVMRKHCISRMTVGRYRKEALRQIAVIVDNYMTWKAQSLFA